MEERNVAFSKRPASKSGAYLWGQLCLYRHKLRLYKAGFAGRSTDPGYII